MSVFRFKQFDVDDAGCGMKICTDSVLLGAWADVSEARQVLDIGTGSGLLALMVAQRATQAMIVAVEKEMGAAEAARQNFAASPWSDRLNVICGDVFSLSYGDVGISDVFYTRSPFDFAICNPPYFTEGLTSPDVSRATARHSSGLSPLTTLALASSMLGEGGRLAMVTPAGNEDQIIYEAEMQRLRLERLCRVHTTSRKPPTRLLWQFARNRSTPQQITSLSIHLPSGEYSTEYISLTSPFYLNL